MKPRLKLALTFAVIAMVISTCKKHECTSTYTMYIPVYKTTAEVRANVKSNPPAVIKSPGKMFVLGQYIYLNEFNKGIHIIDNANPALPVNKYFINIPGNFDVAVSGNTLYADMYSDLLTLDISDPTNIVLTKVNENAFLSAQYFNGFAPDHSKIVVDYTTKDTTVTTSCNPDPVQYQASQSAIGGFSSATGVAGSMARFALLNNYLYTATDNAINVFNIVKPIDPVFKTKVTLPWGVQTIYPFRNNLFIGSMTGMFIFGTANPELPNQLGTFSHLRTCDPVIADGDYAFVTLSGGSTCGGSLNELDVLNIQNINLPTLVKTYPLTGPRGLSKDGNALFVCDGSSGLKIFDASNVNDIKLLKTVTGMNTYDVITVQGVALVVAFDGLYQYNYADLNDPKLLSKIAYLR